MRADPYRMAKSLVAMLLGLVVAAALAAPAGAASYRHCSDYTSNPYVNAGQITAKRVSCGQTHEWITAYVSEIPDNYKSVLGRQELTLDDEVVFSCVGRMRQGPYNPYVHVACRGVTPSYYGRAMRFNLGT